MRQNKRIRKIITIKALITSIIFSIPLFVLANDVHQESLAEVLRAIQQSQGAQEIRDIDCNKVSDQQFEEVGDAVMETMHPGEQHELMDQMMARLPTPERSDGGQGGEGSDSLKTMHITMGQNYLNCSQETTNTTGGMMGWFKNNLGEGGDNSMMGNFSDLGVWSSFGWIFMIAFWTLIIIGIVALIKWLIAQSSPGSKEKSPLDILKERYAKGEINHKEFERMKKDLD